MRFQLLYSTILVGLLFVLGGLFFLLLQTLGLDGLRDIRNRICLPEENYQYRKKKILVVAFLILSCVFILLRVGYFDILRLGVTFFLLFAGILVFFICFLVYFNIDRLVSWMTWFDNRLIPGSMGIIGFLLLSYGLILHSSALLLFLFYQLK